MIAYASRYYDKLLSATLEHLEIVVITLLISLALAALLTVACICFPWSTPSPASRCWRC